jgi:hypothetical protein
MVNDASIKLAPADTGAAKSMASVGVIAKVN